MDDAQPTRPPWDRGPEANAPHGRRPANVLPRSRLCLGRGVAAPPFLVRDQLGCWTLPQLRVAGRGFGSLLRLLRSRLLAVSRLAFVCLLGAPLIYVASPACGTHIYIYMYIIHIYMHVCRHVYKS